MQRRIFSVLGFVGFLAASSVATNSWAGCGPGGAPTITNVPTLGGTMINIFALGPSGDVGGYSGLPGDNVIDAFVYRGGGAVVDIGTFGGSFGVVNAINQPGQAVGYSFTINDAEAHAFLYDSNGTRVDLGTLGGTFSTAVAVNAGGQVAGSANLSGDGTQHAFRYSGGIMTDLGSLGGDFSFAAGINGAGVVIGDSFDENFKKFGFVCTNNTMVTVGDLGSGSYSSARAINDAGMVVGESSTTGGQTHAFSYFAGTISDLGDLGGGVSTASAINNAGQIMGISFTATSDQHAFIYSGGLMTDLGGLGGPTTTPSGINNLGQIVGASQAADLNFYAFLWQNGVMTDLNSLLPTNSGWVLTSAQFINDAGRIVGQGTLNGSSQWFVLDLTSGTANSAPVAIATPAEQTVNCQSAAMLDGTASSDADHDTLRYAWSENGSVLGTNAMLTVSLGLGTHTLTLKVTDACDAFSQASAVVHVVDTNAPVIVGGPAPVTVKADGNCQGAVPNVASGIVATDTCTPTNLLVITQNPAAGTMLGLGQHSIIVTVKDGSGNATMGSTYFTVIDATPPVIVSVPGPLTVPIGNDCSGVVPNVVSSIVATDTCTPANQLVVMQDPVAGTRVEAGTHNIVITVKDAAGNATKASVQFTVADTTPPVIRSLPGPIRLAPDTHCPSEVPNVAERVVATDNCTPAHRLVVTQSPAAGTRLGLGTNIVVVTVKDLAGNTTTGNVMVIVKDTTPPTIKSLKVNPNTLSPSNHRMVPVTVSVNATDNFDPAPVSKIVSITCNESAPASDMVITGNLTASLAATRNGGGHGRVYTIKVKCTDASGNCSVEATLVTVGH